MNQLKDGERHGYWEQYHEDGSLSSKGNYIDGNRDGLWEYYHKNGQPSMKGNYKDGKEDGLWEFYQNKYENDFRFSVLPL